MKLPSEQFMSWFLLGESLLLLAMVLYFAMALWSRPRRTDDDVEAPAATGATVRLGARCPECDDPLPDGARFCVRCGVAQQRHPTHG